MLKLLNVLPCVTLCGKRVPSALANMTAEELGEKAEIAVRICEEKMAVLVAEFHRENTTPMRKEEIKKDLTELKRVKAVKMRIMEQCNNQTFNLAMAQETAALTAASKDTVIKTRDATRQSSAIMRQIGTAEQIDRLRSDFEESFEQSAEIIGLVSSPIDVLSETDQKQIDSDINDLLYATAPSSMTPPLSATAAYVSPYTVPSVPAGLTMRSERPVTASSSGV